MQGHEEFEVEIPVPEGMTEDQAIEKYMKGVEDQFFKNLGL